jgi:hypothetical protein
MATNKEYLKLLLEFIAKILNEEGNEWFHDELAILFSKKIISEKDTGIKLSAVTIKELGSIDKYLEEGLIPLIDYSKISDEKVKFQLERDAIEMGKFRLSNYSNPISFQKFCKYAHFQSEGLVNFYYQKISKNNLDEIINIICQHNPKFAEKIENNQKSAYTSLSSIPFSIKQFALSHILKLDRKYSFAIKDISNVRNVESHRAPKRRIDSRSQIFIFNENYNLVYDAIEHLKNKIVRALNMT